MYCGRCSVSSDNSRNSSRLRKSPQPLLRARLPAYLPQDITTVLWAVATLRPRQPVVAALLASSPRTWAGAGGWTPLELTTDQLSTAAWALAACGAAGAESPQLLRLWQEICERRDAFLGAAKTRFSLLRIHQVRPLPSANASANLWRSISLKKKRGRGYTCTFSWGHMVSLP